MLPSNFNSYITIDEADIFEMWASIKGVKPIVDPEEEITESQTKKNKLMYQVLNFLLDTRATSTPPEGMTNTHLKQASRAIVRWLSLRLTPKQVVTVLMSHSIPKDFLEEPKKEEKW